MRRISGLKQSCVVLLVGVAVPVMAQAPQSPNFNRTTTVRREVTAGPAWGGQETGAVSLTTPPRGTADDLVRPYRTRAPGPAASARSRSTGAPTPLRAPQPMSIQVRSTPHAFYPGMRTSQGPNLNVASPARQKPGRTGLPMIPGMMMPGGMMGPVPSSGPIGK
jgi:hypothetical protein